MKMTNVRLAQKLENPQHSIGLVPKAEAAN
jgi:hypothetical protein